MASYELKLFDLQAESVRSNSRMSQRADIMPRNSLENLSELEMAEFRLLVQGTGNEQVLNWKRFKKFH